MRSSIYRKIWEEHNGKIPVDDKGRTFEIHHIDGNRNNNDISNLLCVSIEEHYAIHLRQGDWNACLRMSERMNLTQEQKTELASKSSSGKIMITNGVDDRKIAKDLPIPEGWQKGRTKGKRFGPRSEEFCKKMSEIKKGVPLSDKHKQSLKGLTRGMSGKKHTTETRAKMSAALKGIPKSEEHKRSMSLAKRKKNND
jgi:hypothetical protein